MLPNDDRACPALLAAIETACERASFEGRTRSEGVVAQQVTTRSSLPLNGRATAR